MIFFSSIVNREVLNFWERARIPTQELKRCASKLEALYHEWQQIKKTHRRDTSAQRKKEAKFSDSLNDLFDIAHGRALDTIKNEEDRKFLLLQRQRGRPGSMIGVDRVLAGREGRSAARKRAEEERRERFHREMADRRRLVDVSDISGSGSGSSSGNG